MDLLLRGVYHYREVVRERESISGLSDCLVKWCENFGRDFKLVGLCSCVSSPSLCNCTWAAPVSVSVNLTPLFFPKVIWFWRVQSVTNKEEPKLRKMLYPCPQETPWLISEGCSYSYQSRNRSYQTSKQTVQIRKETHSVCVQFLYSIGYLILVKSN